ncbi:MAG: hypothetical protein Q4B36_08480 [Tissierellia bacterium]|nr:hypothetical protein [Tissierellia bacterium]
MILSAFLLSSCSNKNTDIYENRDFPIDYKGYPKSDIVIINEKPYSINLIEISHTKSKINSKIDVKIKKDSDIIEIILPQYIYRNNWSIEKNSKN